MPPAEGFPQPNTPPSASVAGFQVSKAARHGRLDRSESPTFLRFAVLVVRDF